MGEMSEELEMRCLMKAWISDFLSAVANRFLI